MKAKDLLGCVVWAALFLLAMIWVPLFGPFLSLFTPLPFVYYAVKLGVREGVKLAALTTLTIGIAAKLAGFPQVFLFALEFSVLGIVLAELFRRRLDIGLTIFLGTGSMLLVALGILAYFAFSSDQGLVEMLMRYLKGHLQATLRSYGEAGLSPEKAAELEGYGTVFLDTIAKIYPALMVVGTGFVVWLNVMFSRGLLRLRRLEYPEFKGLDRWRSPERLVWGVIGSGFALFLASGPIQWLAANVLIVLMTVYMFHGVSILLFFLNKYRLPSWAKAGVYILIAIQQVFLALLAVFGLFDQWVDFRRVHRRMEA